MVWCEVFSSSRRHGYDGFMQGNQAVGVLGLADSNLILYNGNEDPNFAYSTETHFTGPLKTAKSLPDGPKEYYEIVMPRKGETGKVFIGGRAANEAQTARTDVKVNTGLLNGSQGGPVVQAQQFCLDGAACYRSNTGLGAGIYVLDSLALTIRTSYELADQVAKRFSKPALLTYIIDNLYIQALYEVDCGAIFNGDVRMRVDGVDFALAAEDMIVQVPQNRCISAIQPIRPQGRVNEGLVEARLGWPFFRNVVLGVHTDQKPGNVHIEGRTPLKT
jgi:hypothetical protein